MGCSDGYTVTDKRLFEIKEKVKNLDNIFITGVRLISSEEKILIKQIEHKK